MFYNGLHACFKTLYLPNFSPAPSTAPAPQPVSSENDRTANEARAKETVSVNASEPTTSVQIRLADGSRLIGTFNQSHTIADLRTYITTYPFKFNVNTIDLFSVGS